MAPILAYEDGPPLVCFHGDCQEPADDAYTTAPVFKDDGTTYAYVHCSAAHLAATMATRPEFADVQPPPSP